MILSDDHGDGDTITGIPVDYFKEPTTANHEVVFTDKAPMDRACIAAIWLYFLGFTISFGGR